ncbi:MAG: PHP domain-containing protein, partial [Saprospiraceae bacterium]
MYLNCHSYHSLRFGTISTEDLVALAVANDVKALALTDINASAAVFDFIKDCQAANIKPLIGIEFRTEAHKLNYVALARSQIGFAEMCKYRTTHNIEKTEMPNFAPEFEDVIVIYPLENSPENLKDYEYIGVKPEQLIKLYRKEWRNRIEKMVILQPVTFRSKKEFNLHKILRAVDDNVVLSKLSEQHYSPISEQMIPIGQLISKYKDYPQIVSNTEDVIELCDFKFDFKPLKNKKYYTRSRHSDKQLLTSLANEGLLKRYGKSNKEAQARVNKELQ